MIKVSEMDFKEILRLLGLGLVYKLERHEINNNCNSTNSELLLL